MTTTPQPSASLTAGTTPPAATAIQTAKPARAARPRRRRPGPRRSTPLTIAMLAALAYFLLPLFWLVIASTKSTQDLFNTFGLWFSHAPQLLTNVKDTFTQDDGVFVHWLLNTAVYAVVSAVGAITATSTAGGIASNAALATFCCTSAATWSSVNMTSPTWK